MFSMLYLHETLENIFATKSNFMKNFIKKLKSKKRGVFVQMLIK